MAHTHDVYDTGKCFEINETSRFIQETSPTKLVLVQGDHKSEVITFKMPRYIDGHDMLTCNKIRVHYINIDTKTNDTSKDIYEVKNLALCEDDESMLTFTWVIEAPATKYAGTLSFLIKFECTEGDDILYQWNTAKYVGTNVLVGIDNSEAFIEKYSSVLEQWYNKLTNGADSIEEHTEQALAEIETAKEEVIGNIGDLENINNTIAEVEDIRTDYKGYTYYSAGQAVREQIEEVIEIATRRQDHCYSKTVNYSGEDMTLDINADFYPQDLLTFKYLVKDKDLVEIVYIMQDDEEIVPIPFFANEEYELINCAPTDDYKEIRFNSYVEAIIRTRGTVQDLKLELEDLKENIESNGFPSVGGSGISESAKELLITILKAGAYTSNQSANINALKTALGISSSDNTGGSGSGGNTDLPDVPDVPDNPTDYITQNGSVLTILGGVETSQNGSVLTLS